MKTSILLFLSISLLVFGMFAEAKKKKKKYKKKAKQPAVTVIKRGKLPIYYDDKKEKNSPVVDGQVQERLDDVKDDL